MGAGAMTPKPPPGFELVQTPDARTPAPSPPPGFELVRSVPSSGGVLDKVFPEGVRPAPRGEVSRVGDSLKPIFGGHNPIAETVDLVTPALDASTERGIVDRATDTAAFLAAAPFQAFRAPTPGQMVERATGYSGVSESEQSFVDNNPRLVRFLGAVGEVAPGMSWSRGMGAAPQNVQVPAVPGSRAVRRAHANTGERGAYGTIVDDLGGSVDEFANQVAVGGARFDVGTNRRTLDILGEEMQRHGGNVPAAQAATISRIVDETGLAPQTAREQIRRLSRVHEDSELMLGEYPAVAASDAAQRLRRSDNIDLDELGRVEASRTQDKIDYLANNGAAQSAQDVRNAISRRQENLAPAMRETLEDIGPKVELGPKSSRPANITDAQEFIDNARTIGQQEYRAAQRAPVNNRLSVHFLPRILDANLHRAAGRAGEPAAAIRRAVDQFYIPVQGGQRFAMNTLQQLQDARGAVRGQISEYHRAGRADLANAVQPFYEQITRLMTRMSPEWARANARWRDLKFDEFAQELGDAFATTAGPRFRQQLSEFKSLAPEAQDIVRVHFLQKLYDKLDNLGDSHSVSKLFSNDQSRTMIRQLLGDEAAVSFTRAVRDQKVAESSQRMLANSATHRRGVAQKQMDAETGLVAAVENASVRGVRSWLVERATQLITERRNKPLARVLTTPMSDTAEIARHIYNMRQQQNRLMQIDAPRSVSVREGNAMALGAGSANIAESNAMRRAR